MREPEHGSPEVETQAEESKLTATTNRCYGVGHSRIVSLMLLLDRSSRETEVLLQLLGSLSGQPVLWRSCWCSTWRSNAASAGIMSAEASNACA